MMSYDENRTFIEGLQELLKKHNLAVMFCKDSEKLSSQTKHLEGYHMFFTKGEKKNYLRGGENFNATSSLIVKFPRTNTEDDGC